MKKDGLKNVVNNCYIILNNDEMKYGENAVIFKYQDGIRIKYKNNEYNSEIFLKEKNFKQVTNIIFELDFSNDLEFEQASILIKNIIKIGKIAKKNKIKIGIEKYHINILGKVINGNSQYENDVISSIGVLVCNNKKQRYEFLYDQICDYLDKEVITKNVCGFENNKCIAKRNTNCNMGCCHHFKNKYFGILYETKLQLCEYQQDKRCTAKCISCKMYMCDYLVKRGYKFTCSNVLLIKHYFNLFQKIVIKSSFFTPKDKILKIIYLFCIK